MKLKANEYRVDAVEPSRMRVSRHGISQSKGGQILESFTFQWPDTPVYQAEQILKGNNPDADIRVTYSKELHELAQRGQ